MRTFRLHVNTDRKSALTFSSWVWLLKKTVQTRLVLVAAGRQTVAIVAYTPEQTFFQTSIEKVFLCCLMKMQCKNCLCISQKSCFCVQSLYGTDPGPADTTSASLPMQQLRDVFFFKRSARTFPPTQVIHLLCLMRPPPLRSGKARSTLSLE